MLIKEKRYMPLEFPGIKIYQVSEYPQKGSTLTEMEEIYSNYFFSKLAWDEIDTTDTKRS